MKIYLAIILITLSFISCQNDKFITLDLVGDWEYERETSSTFNYLLDFDKRGIISFDSDGVGIWNESNGKYNFDLEWILDGDSQKIEITKFDQDQNLEIVDKIEFCVERINNMTLILEFEEEIISPLDPSFFMLSFENIKLTRI